MIGIDWGTSSFRAFRIVDAGVTDRIASAFGIMQIAENGFEAHLRQAIGPWLAAGETRILMSGMIGSRQGWVEAAYLPCPADTASIAEALTQVPFCGCDLRIVPGLCGTDTVGTPEVMRGEETQIIGAGATGIVCLPGSHSKWVRVSACGRIEGFETIMSGEIFAALRKQTILGRMMPEAPHDNAAFDRGVARSGEPGHLLHHLFGVRALGLFDRLAPEQSASYLSGLLIGHEVRAYLLPGAPGSAHVTLLGSENLCALYTRAIIHCGGTASTGPADAAASGLALIGSMTRWT
jgi:2-dehydro-3-deoxygalactonokinase